MRWWRRLRRAHLPAHCRCRSAWIWIFASRCARQGFYGTRCARTLPEPRCCRRPGYRLPGPPCMGMTMRSAPWPRRSNLPPRFRARVSSSCPESATTTATPEPGPRNSTPPTIRSRWPQARIRHAHPTRSKEFRSSRCPRPVRVMSSQCCSPAMEAGPGSTSRSRRHSRSGAFQSRVWIRCATSGPPELPMELPRISTVSCATTLQSGTARARS